MSHYATPPRRSSLPLVLAGAAFVMTSYLVLDRAGWFRSAPSAEPRPITPRGDLMEVERTTTTIFARYSPAVVHITTEVLARTMFGIQRHQEGTGTGFLWDAGGTVVTNHHVVKSVLDSGGRLKIALGDEIYDGAPIGQSPQHDIAVLRIVAPPRDLVPIPIGSSGDLQVGQTVLAIGNPYGFERSLTTGIISALNRSIETAQSQMNGLIQTDAAINPGNSGGPLLDSSGRLIGMTTAIYSPSGTSAGIGFAVPVDSINEVVPQLLDGNTAQRYLGATIGASIRLDRRTGHSVGVPILAVEQGAGAEAAGLRPCGIDGGQRIISWGDVIVAIDGTQIRSISEVHRMLRGRKRGEQVKVTVLRGEPDAAQQVEVSVALK
ncbi:MAG: trypsin-like peptidase domain-containing protein [Planctomycetes bacterium]|jgi:S1-C subfamily serine protease|nr:trypsin-like peptidase domain-containing protein [Planctomycetota bacterium]